MPAQLFDVSPRGSSAYSVPTFSALSQGLSQFGAGIGAGLQERRLKREAAEKKAKADAALKAAFGAFEQGGNDAVFQGLASGAYGDDVLKSLFPVMQMRQAQENADREYDLALRKLNAGSKSTPKFRNYWDPINKKVTEVEVGSERHLRLKEAGGYQIGQGEGTAEDLANLGGDEDAASKAMGALQRWNAGLPEINEGMQFLTTPEQFKGKALAFAERLGIDIGEGNRDDLAAQAAFKRTVMEQLSLFINELSGAAVSEQEAERLMKAMPNLNDSPTEFKAKYDSLINQLESKVKSFAGDQAVEMPEMALNDPPTGVSPLDVIDAVDGAGQAQAAPGGIPSIDAIGEMTMPQINQVAQAVVDAFQAGSMPAEEVEAFKAAIGARTQALQAPAAPGAVTADATPSVMGAGPSVPGAPQALTAPTMAGTDAGVSALGGSPAGSAPAAPGGALKPDLSHIVLDKPPTAPPTVEAVSKMDAAQIAEITSDPGFWVKYPHQVANAIMKRRKELAQAADNRRRRAPERDLIQSYRWLWGD